MAEKNVKAGRPIPIVYQAPNKETGAVVKAEIYTPAGTKDPTNYPDLTLPEVGTTGVYQSTFTPADPGEWVVLVHKENGDGQVVKRFSVGTHNLDSIGADVNSLQTGQAAIVAGQVSITDQITALSNQVGGLDTPPMIS